MRCKTGDLAVIRKSPLQQNLDKFVEVLRYEGEHSQYGPVWLVKSQSTSGIVTELGVTTTTCHIPDDWLTPIRGDVKNETNDERIPYATQ